MKKILIALTLIVALATTAQAQLLNFGFRGGAGMAVHIDDIADNSPILAANLGAFCSFGFTNSQSVLAENLWLQTGVSLVRRGSHFQEVLERLMSIREGVYKAYYLQIPVLATYRYELPVREPGHIGFVSLGPAFNYGLFGTMDDRKITRGFPQEDWNYRIEDAPVFDKLNRLDVSFIFGVGYEYQDLSVMLQLDYGFMAVCTEPDAIQVNQENVSSPTVVPQGNNLALLLTVGYQFPVR